MIKRRRDTFFSGKVEDLGFGSFGGCYEVEGTYAKVYYSPLPCMCSLYWRGNGDTSNKQQPLLGETGPFGSNGIAQSSHEEPRQSAEQVSAVDSPDKGRLYIYVMHDSDQEHFLLGFPKAITLVHFSRDTNELHCFWTR